MQISAVNNNYNIATKSQYDNSASTNNITTDFPAYVEDEPKQKNNMGMTLLGIAGLACLGIGLYKAHSAKSAIKALEETKASLEKTKTTLEKQVADIQGKLDIKEKALETANAELESLKNPVKKPNFFKRLVEKFNNWRKGTVL